LRTPSLPTTGATPRYSFRAAQRCDPGRISQLVVPPVELATIVHAGPDTSIDRAYGALGAYVTQHALAVDGPIREYYLVGPTDTDDETLWRTEVGWPIFQTRLGS
jgi:effector-binding domain-containing protein